MALARTPPADAIRNLATWSEWARCWFQGGHTLKIKRKPYATLGVSIFGLIGLALFWPGWLSPSKTSPTDRLQQIPFTDDEVHGWLKPANHPTPRNGCDTTAQPDDIKILIGDNGIVRTGYGKIIALEIGSCEALSIERSPQGVFVNAEFNDGSGASPVRIKNNEIFAQNGQTYSARQTRDFSSIKVVNKPGDLILDAEFLNPTTLKVNGSFGCTGGKSIAVKDDQPVPGFFMSHSCVMNSRVGIHVN